MLKRKFFYINFFLLVSIIFTGKFFRESIYKKEIGFDRNAKELISKERKKEKKVLEEISPDWFSTFNTGKTSLENYSSVSEKNLFRSERIEWQPPPPPPPPPKKKEIPPPPPPDEPKPEELPDPFLYGIVMAGKNKRLAIMRGYGEAEKQEPRYREIRVSGVKKKIPLPSRPVKPKLAAKSSIYEVGDYVSGAKIVSIEKDSVQLERNEGKVFAIKLFDKSIKKPKSAVARSSRSKKSKKRRSWSSYNRKSKSAHPLGKSARYDDDDDDDEGSGRSSRRSARKRHISGR